MPRAKRNKVVSLTKTPKRNTRDSKASHIEAIRTAASEYPTIVVFYISNLRNTHLQEVRSLWKENSKVFFGKNKVVARALGIDAESEVREGLSKLTRRLQGPVGVLFTKSSPDEVAEWFADYAREDFSRGGNIATQDVELEAGPIMLSLDPPENLPHSLEPQLRGLGMPTELKRGVPTLLEPFVVAKKGQKLTAEKAQILKHLLIKDAKFRLIPIVHWTDESNEVKEFPLSMEDEKTVLELKRADTKMNSGNHTRSVKKVRSQDVIMEQDDDEDDADEDEEFDDDIVGDKVTKSMMLPVGA